MTNEEAIEFAKEQLEIFGEDSTMYEFLEFSIKALEERPKGKWTEHEDYVGDTYYTCSNCGNDWCTIEGSPVDNMMNFCPNCGADMRGEENA